MDNEVVNDLTSSGQTAYKNAQTQRHGAEWSIDSQLTPSISARANLSLMKAYYVNTGATLPGVATKSLFAELNWEALKGMTLGAEFVARGRLYVDDTNLQMAAPGYGIANLKVVLHQELGHWKFKEFARIDNIGDRLYAGSVIVNESNSRYYETGAPRAYMVGATGSYQF
jgi:iron complex outermembrane receptor protein